MFNRYNAHNEKRALWQKRKRKKSQFADMHKSGLISEQYESVYKYKR